MLEIAVRLHHAQRHSTPAAAAICAPPGHDTLWYWTPLTPSKPRAPLADYSLTRAKLARMAALKVVARDLFDQALKARSQRGAA
jgi:alkylation response protein AidB-like acyl-CoA dehydrogenase